MMIHDDISPPNTKRSERSERSEVYSSLSSLLYCMHTDWREEYKDMKVLSTFQTKLLDEGPHSLAQSWLLSSMYSDWKKKKGISDPEPPNCQSSFKEFSNAHP